MDDITDDDVAAIRAESAAYDKAYPNWRAGDWRHISGIPAAEKLRLLRPKMKTPAPANADIKQWCADLLKKYQKGPSHAVPTDSPGSAGDDGGGDPEGVVVVLD